jgi:hypothetical protein
MVSTTLDIDKYQSPDYIDGHQYRRRRDMDPYASGIAWMIDAPHRRREERELALRLALRRTGDGRPGLVSRLRSLVGGPDSDTAPVACCTSPSAA